MNKNLIIILVAVLLVGGGAFYGGMKYGQSKNSLGGISRQNFQNLSEEQRQQLFQGNIGGNLQRENGRGGGANFLNGEVIAKDEQSLTIKMADGGSKIVFFSSSTQISKMANVSINDIEIGKSVTVNGKTNQDGSLTAQSIQIRPETSNLP